MFKSFKFITSLLALILISSMAWGQGATTAALRGKVVDDKGNPLENANVILIHEPSGSQYGTMTLQDGRFTIAGVRVGGPYKVIISSIGYAKKEQSGIYLNLNQTLQLSFVLKQSDLQIEEVTVSYDKGNDMSTERTGAETFIKSKEINSLPTISRGQKDFTRLTPQSDGNSFGGRNNLYNNFSLDGSIFNNSFGLDYATPGGQADAQPVSLDAIEQIQVSLAPFDVREGGFTGAGVNAVTRSGTNNIDASVYYYFRNEAMIGDKVGDTKVPNLDFNTKLYGFRVGGPIIKNKLFFFINAESERKEELAHGFVARDDAGQTDPNVTSVLRSDIEAVQQHFRDVWGYDPGAYEGYNHKTSNDKVLAKLDWNISDKHHFTIRYNYLNAWKDILPHPEAIIGRGPTSFRLPFENSSYRIFNKINSVVSELNSRFGSKFSNKLLVGYTAFRDHREPKSVPFPVVDIFDANGNLAITAGSEMFSTHNILNQNVFQFTDNFSYYMNKHTLTAGVNVEIFKFENSFNLFYYPWVAAFSVQDFLNDNLVNMLTGAPVTPSDIPGMISNSEQTPYAWSYVDVAQLGFYIQDEFSATDNLNLTFGLRVDVPVYLNSLEPDPTIQNFNGWVDEDGNSVKVDPSKWPDANLLWAPRFGFNWDTKGDQTLMLRGGTGIFSGRVPFVWLGNQASNSKMYPGYTFQINSTSEGFKFPQVWKSDLAVDYKFADNWIFSFEGIYSKDINAVVHRNYDMMKPSAQLSGTGDNRAVFAGFNETHIYASSADAIGFLDAGVIVMDNVKEGAQYSLTGQLKKSFDFGLYANASYTYMQSKDYTSIPAEIAADAFQRNPVVGDPNQPMYSYSRYGLKHRIIATLMYQHEYKNMASSFALFWETGKGNRYSYTYVGDLNQDGIVNNDLLYIPENQSDINFGTVNNGNGVPAADAAEQWAALDAFIEQDPYLSEHRGEYAERNGAMQPWFTQVDFKFMQDFKIKSGEKTNTLRLSFDVLNIGNMLNSNWGIRQIPATTNLLTVNGLDNNNVPYFSFDTNLKETYIDDVSIISKWQLQIGIRWIFH